MQAGTEHPQSPARPLPLDSCGLQSSAKDFLLLGPDQEMVTLVAPVSPQACTTGLRKPQSAFPESQWSRWGKGLTG